MSSPAPQDSERPALQESDSTSIASGLRIVSLCTLASRVLGLARDIGMAALFGAGPAMDAFSVAFRIPNLFRRLFGEGALTAAFLPVFVREERERGLPAAWTLGSAVLGILTAGLCGLTLVGELSIGLAWEFGSPGPEARLLLGLTGAMLPYVVLICVAAQLSAMLNALQRFAWPAIAPVLLNLVWIGGLLWLAPRFEDEAKKAYVITGCILVAGVLQCAALWWPLRQAGFRFVGCPPAVRDRVREVFAAMLPVLLGLVVSQVNTLADSLIAWGFARGENDPPTMPLWGSPAWPVSVGAASALYFGQRLYQFPLGIFGVALSTVMFPRLARHADEGRRDRLQEDLFLGLRLVIAIGLPASAGLVLLAEPATALFFQHGAFDAFALKQTASVVAAYGTAVWAWCALLILTRASYAAGDRRTPLRLSVLAVGVNLLLNATFVWPWGATGLALATSLTAMLQAGAAAWLLQESVGRIDWRAILSTLWRSLIAAAVMTAVGLLLLDVLPDRGELLGRLSRVAVTSAVAFCIYAVAARLLRIEEFWFPFRRTRR